MNFSVILGNANNDTLELSYTLNASHSAKIWWNCLQQATKSSLVENAVFYNFERNETEKLCLQLDESLDILKRSIPALSTANLDRSNLQSSLNELHTNFAHSHLVENSVTTETAPHWSRFNLLIHQIESALVASKTKTALGLCRIEFSWKNNYRTEILPECFAEYTFVKAFGSVQITYCQVGRQLSELFAAQDSTVPAEHIQPARYFSANTGLWFGPDLGLSFETQYVESIRLWYMQNRAKFEAADIFWDSADRALGTVTVAQLNRKFISLDERKLFQQTLSRFDRVLSVIC